jgi:uncharacterized protein YjbI with pentapeptide repeats
MLEDGAEGGAIDTSSLPGALDFMALWVGSAGSDGVRLNLSSVDLRRTPLAYANLVGAKLDRSDFRDESSLMLS